MQISKKNLAASIFSFVWLTVALPVHTLAEGSSKACLLSSGQWVNVPLTQVGTREFRISFDATPSSSTVDAVTGLSSGRGSEYKDLAAIVRFNSLGNIDARDGSTYAAISVIHYVAGVTYQFILDVNVATHSYSVYVMLGSVRTTIGANLAFRSEQASVSSLSDLNAMTSVGSHTVCNVRLSSSVAPSITAQPGSVTVASGQGASFSVASTGTAPLNYQWYKNRSPISGANSSSYTTPLTVSADNGAKVHVVVSNGAGSTTSNVATLMVIAPAPHVECLSSSKTWANTTLAQRQTGSFLTSFDATPSASEMNGVTGLSTEAANGYQSLAAAVRFSPSGTIDARNGGSFTATQAIPYSAGTTYHFLLDVNVANHTYSAYVMIGSIQITVGTHLAFRTEQGGASSLNYVAARAMSGSHTVCKVPEGIGGTSAPAITSQPANITAQTGRSANFSVSASGTALSYQWKKNGVVLSGATSSSYTTPLTVPSDSAAQFTVVVSNPGGSVTSNPGTLTVSPASRLLNSSVSSLDFGNVPISSRRVQNVTVTNAGDAEVTISQVSVAGAGFNATGVGGLILSPGNSATVAATFEPAATGAATGSVTVSSNATNSVMKISLSGTGVSPAAHSVNLSWTAGNLGVAGYHAYSSVVSGGPYLRVTSTPLSSPHYTDTSVQSGRTYYYVVTAVNTSNEESAYSSEVVAVIP